jgi:hypothetical protein
MRVSEPLRWLTERHPGLADGATTGEGRQLRRRRWLYLNFVIWRKLRVVDKAARRGQHFTCRWYQMQVVDHLVEAQALLLGVHAPPLHRYDPEGLGFLTAPVLRMLLEQPADTWLGDTGNFLGWGWHQLHKIQQTLIERAQLSEQATADPLATQWDTQYWKYENLFS